MSPSPPHPAPRFDAAPHRPDGGFELLGLLLTPVLCIAAGVAAGLLAAFLGQWFYAIILFPAGIGVAAGLAGAFGARVGKVRNGPLAWTIGIIGGCAAVFAMHYFEYWITVPQMQLARPVGMKGPISFAKFIDMSAVAGVTIVGKGGGQGMNLGYYGSYIYWFVELLIVIVIEGMLIHAQVTDPFCTVCKTWKQGRELGRVDMHRDIAYVAITSGDLTRLADRSNEPGLGVFKLAVFTCPNCGDTAPVEVNFKGVSINQKGEESEEGLAMMTYPGEAIHVLEALYDNQQTPQQVAATPAINANRKPGRECTVTLKPIDKKEKGNLWGMDFDGRTGFLYDAAGDLVATIRPGEMKTRMVFPNWFDNVWDFGILADHGSVVWFKNTKAAIKTIKEALRKK